MNSRTTGRTARSVTLPLLHVVPRERAEQHILAVTFRADDDRRWYAIGGGETVAAAIECARDSCPDDVAWEVARWNDLYGD